MAKTPTRSRKTPRKVTGRPVRRARNGRDPGKIALVLAGGGIIGGVYQIGALKALNDFLVGRTVNDLDLYVGTSCGAFVASCLANRITPEEMMVSMGGEEVDGFSFERSDLLKLNVGEAAGRMLTLPFVMAEFWWKSLRRLRPFPPLDAFYKLVQCLPAGIYDSGAVDRMLARIFEQRGTNDFSRLSRDLHVTATDLDTSQLRVFSRTDGPSVSVSRAVAASTAIPVVYNPVRIEGRDYVDGGLNDTMHVEEAVKRGAKLVICINPLVSYVKEAAVGQERGHHVFSLGFPFIGKQVVRTILATRVIYDLRLLRRRRPDVDVILIQPDAHDFKMFYNPIMRYATRVELAVHGFASAARTLASDYRRHHDILARHGLRTRLDNIAETLEAIEAVGPRSRGAAAILEGVARQYREDRHPKGVLKPLGHALHDLEISVGERARRVAGARG